MRERNARMARQVAINAAAATATTNALAAAATALAQQSFGLQQGAVNTALGQTQRLMRMYSDFLKKIDLAIIHFVAQFDHTHGFNLDTASVVSHLDTAFPAGSPTLPVAVGPGVTAEGGNGAVSGAPIGTATTTPGVTIRPPMTSEPTTITMPVAPTEAGTPGDNFHITG